MTINEINEKYGFTSRFTPVSEADRSITSIMDSLESKLGVNELAVNNETEVSDNGEN